MVATPRHFGYLPGGQPIEPPLPTHRIIFDEVIIQDLSNALPVTLISFTANQEQGSTLLRWETSQEANSDRFEIEHSADSKIWKMVGALPAMGDRNIISRYSYNHQWIYGTNYYRLKMIDRDGTFAYSNVRSVSNDIGESVSLFPNPGRDFLYIKTSGSNKVVKVLVNDILGRKVLETVPLSNSGIPFSSLTSGIYFVSLYQQDGSTYTSRILVKK